MNNLFCNEEHLTINEKYDLKGSWVSRNSTPPRDGQIFSCTYCEQSFIFRRKKRRLLPRKRGHHHHHPSCNNHRSSMKENERPTLVEMEMNKINPLVDSILTDR
jgi:hypothetical protein